MTSARHIPPSLAPLVEDLELERTTFVTLAQLGELMRRHSVRGAPALIASRLRELGWLLPTGVRGSYEFAPAERAGPYSRGGPLRRLQALRAEQPRLPLAVALGSALALLGLADRSPDTPEVALDPAVPVPRSLRDGSVRVLPFAWTLPGREIDGVLVHEPATILVHNAHRPAHVRSWAAMLDALPALVAMTTTDAIRTELATRPLTTRVRFAYLTQGVAPSLAQDLGIAPSERLVWFGPRTTRLRLDSAWSVADTLLPFDPRLLSPADADARP
jgi:hypothetical protein